MAPVSDDLPRLLPPVPGAQLYVTFPIDRISESYDLDEMVSISAAPSLPQQLFGVVLPPPFVDLTEAKRCFSGVAEVTPNPTSDKSLLDFWPQNQRVQVSIGRVQSRLSLDEEGRKILGFVTNLGAEYRQPNSPPVFVNLHLPPPLADMLFAGIDEALTRTNTRVHFSMLWRYSKGRGSLTDELGTMLLPNWYCRTATYYRETTTPKLREDSALD